VLALGSPFNPAYSAAIPPSAALFERIGKTYSLFLIGLIAFYYTKTHLSRVFLKNLSF
jgi:hypothetical protein